MYACSKLLVVLLLGLYSCSAAGSSASQRTTTHQLLQIECSSPNGETATIQIDTDGAICIFLGPPLLLSINE